MRGQAGPARALDRAFRDQLRRDRYAGCRAPRVSPMEPPPDGGSTAGPRLAGTKPLRRGRTIGASRNLRRRRWDRNPRSDSRATRLPASAEPQPAAEPRPKGAGGLVSDQGLARSVHHKPKPRQAGRAGPAPRAHQLVTQSMAQKRNRPLEITPLAITARAHQFSLDRDLDRGQDRTPRLARLASRFHRRIASIHARKPDQAA